MKIILPTVVVLSIFLGSCGKESPKTSESAIAPQDYTAGRRAYDAQDYAAAYKIWLPLANQGESGAQFFVGFLHETGLGVKQDRAEAIKWYLLSSDQNMGDAQARLCRLLFVGQGGPQDNIQAYKWAELSSELGNLDAQNVRRELQAAMQPAELKEAMRLVQEWKDKRAKIAAK